MFVVAQQLTYSTSQIKVELICEGREERDWLVWQFFRYCGLIPGRNFMLPIP